MIDGLTIVKCGGSAGVDRTVVCAGVARLVRDGRRVVVVHGGAAAVEDLANRLGVRLRQIVSPGGVATRRTDAITLELVTLALAGQAKPALVAEFARNRVSAIGLTGIDAGLLTARRKRALRAVVDGRVTMVRDDHSGQITSVATSLLCSLLEIGLVPVVSPPALTEDGEPLNVNADRAAAAVAAAMKPERFVILTSAPGVLAGPREDSVLDEYRVPPEGAPFGDSIGGGMTLKLIAAREALLAGVPEVTIGDGRYAEEVRRALYGVGGTRILPPLSERKALP